MRVDSFNTASAADATDQVSKLKQESTVFDKRAGAGYAAGSEDKTTLSSNSTAVLSLTETALQTSSSRAGRVASLKAAVSSGQYQLDSSATADALAKTEF